MNTLRARNFSSLGSATIPRRLPSGGCFAAGKKISDVFLNYKNRIAKQLFLPGFVSLGPQSYLIALCILSQLPDPRL